MHSPGRASSPVRNCFVLLEPITPKANIEFSSEVKKVINEKNLLTIKTRQRVTEALEEVEHANYESIRQGRKQRIVDEIVESEENYMRQLEVVMQFFVLPVRQQELLKSRDYDVLFMELTTIYKISKELLEELHKTPESVAKAFSKFAPFFKSYSFYASGFKNSLGVLQNCHKDNPKFEKFLELQESRPEVQSKLSALLIVPIQRVPRYKLLLTSLFHLTSPADSFYGTLLDSLQKVEDAADHINKIISDHENMQRLIELQRCLLNQEPNVITPGRRLLKEGPLLNLSSKSSHSQKMHVVLMNDIIMFCKMKKDEIKANSLKCSCIFPLAKSRVQMLHDKGALKVICQDQEMALYHESYEETVKWVEDVQLAVETLLNDRKTLKKESTVRRPVKRKDVGEYNEIGLSPGKRLRKKKSAFESVDRALIVAKRRPLRGIPSLQDNSPSFLITLKPPDVVGMSEDADIEEEDEKVFVFGRPHADRGFSFRMNQWFCGIGASVKKFFGFR